MPKDYLAMTPQDPEDAEWHGVKGMHWGIIRDRATLRASKAAHPTDPKKILVKDSKSGEVHEAPRTKDAPPPAEKPKSNIQDHVESSPDRYARLQAQAKAGRGSEMTEQDLKFFNARTEALSKINKLNEQKPGWLQETSKKVLQQTAQNGMQEVADAVRKKYITGPLIDAVTKK